MSPGKGKQPKCRENKSPVQRRATQEKAQTRQREIDRRKEKGPQSAKKPAQKKDGKQTKKKGQVRTAAVEIEGKKYKAGDLKKLSRTERRVLDRLSEATGVDIVFFESEAGESGRFEGANGFYRDGVVYLDINAGANNVHEKSAVLLTAAHEFVHFIREHSPAQYEILKEFVTERMLADGRAFSTMVRGKMNQTVDGKKLDYDEAVEEVIADACEMVFSDSKSIEALKKKDRGLWSALKNWMHDFLADLQEAFTGVEARHESAKAMNDYISELAERFGVALAEASENAAVVETKGDAKLSLRVNYLNGESRVIRKVDSVTKKEILDFLRQAKERKLLDKTYIPVRTNTPIDIIATMEYYGMFIQDRPLIMNVRKARQSMSSEVREKKQRRKNIRHEGMEFLQKKWWRLWTHLKPRNTWCCSKTELINIEIQNRIM